MIKTFTDFLRKLFTGKHNSPFEIASNEHPNFVNLLIKDSWNLHAWVRTPWPIMSNSRDDLGKVVFWIL